MWLPLFLIENGHNFSLPLIGLIFKLDPSEETFPRYLLADLEWLQTFASIVNGICCLRAEQMMLLVAEQARLGSTWFVSLLVMLPAGPHLLLTPPLS